MKNTAALILLAAGTMGIHLPVASAAIRVEEAARLEQDLTPLGAVRAGSADGVIPAWAGGMTEGPAGYRPGKHHPDPFSSEQPRFVVDASNLEAHRAALPAGLAALIQAYPGSYRLRVYPTHRTAAYPQWLYDNTRAAATTARLTNGGNGIAGAVRAIPFPIPENGLEVIWNHILRYRGVAAARWIAQAAPTRGGDYTLVEFEDEFLFNYYRPGVTEEQLGNVQSFFKQTVISPARMAGGILLVNETLDQVKEKRRAWIYNAGRRRVTRAPDVAYDNPGTASDGMRTSDQFDMFNGAPDRYEWKLIGRREMIVPYNSYRLHSDQVKVKEILTPLHINQDLARYEVHRVWVVEATLRPGMRHIYSRRTYYIDEDSWQVLVADQYDESGAMYRVSEGHSIQYFDALCFWTTLETHTDLLSGRYLALGLDNENRMYNFAIERTPEDFTPASLRREGVR